MTPYYKHMCELLGWMEEAALVKTMKAENDKGSHNKNLNMPHIPPPLHPPHCTSLTPS